MMRQRIITGMIIGILFFSLLILGSYPYLSVILLLLIWGSIEYIQMHQLRLFSFPTILFVLTTLMIAFPSDTLPFALPIDRFDMIWIVVTLWMIYMVFSKNKFTVNQIGILLFGSFYLGIGFHYILKIRMLENDGLFWSLLLFFCIWITDSAAYFIGIRFGRHKLLPEISPKKSIEGSIGGLVFAVLVSILFAFATPELLSFIQAVILGLLISIFGQLGDLIESALKRIRGIKDTGTIFPGHGGVLDRVDSWLLVFPLIYMYGESFGLFLS